MKFDVSILTIDATVATNYENLNAIATNFVDANVDFAFNSARNSNDSIVVNFSINAKKILFVEIIVYDDVNARTKFANVALNYSKL